MFFIFAYRFVSCFAAVRSTVLLVAVADSSSRECGRCVYVFVSCCAFIIQNFWLCFCIISSHSLSVIMFQKCSCFCFIVVILKFLRSKWCSTTTVFVVPKCLWHILFFVFWFVGVCTSHGPRPFMFCCFCRLQLC